MEKSYKKQQMLFFETPQLEKNWLFSVHVLAYILALFIIVSFSARVDRQETCRKLTGRNLNTLIEFQLNKTARLRTTDHTNGFPLISLQSQFRHYFLKQKPFSNHDFLCTRLFMNYDLQH